MRRLGVSGVLFVVACVAAQFVPLTNVIGYEYSVLVGALLSLLGLARLLRAPADDRDVWERAASDALPLLAAVGVATVISLLNGLRVPSCEPLVGLAYVAVFSLLTIPTVVATAAVARALSSGRRRYAVAYGAVALSVVHSLVYLATQPDITVYDPYVGYFAGSIYDESLVGFTTHGWFRVGTIGGSALALCVVAWIRTRRALELRWIVGLIPLLACLWWWRGDLGLHKSRGYVQQELGGFIATEHFDLYFDASAYDARRLELLVADHEAEYQALAAFWGVEPDRRLRSFVYGSRDEKGRLMGGRRTLVAKIWLGEMHITWSGPGSTLLSHEMAHLFLRDAGRGPLDLASSFGVVPIMALVEGAATAAGWGGGDWDEHHWSAAMIDEGFAEDISELLGPFGFWSRYSRRAYTLTGSFARYLIEVYGPEPFLDAYGDGGFERAYGRPLGELVAEWQGWLETLERSDALRRAARWRFDRSSLFGRRCARSIATRMDEGDALLRAGQRDAAARCFASVIEDDPGNVRRRLDIAERLLRIERRDEALAQVAWVLAEEGTSLAERARAQELQADEAWRTGDRAAAEVTYQALADAAGTEADERRLLAKLEAVQMAGGAPRSAAAVRRALVAWPPPPTPVVVAELLEAWRTEQQPLTAYLAVLRLTGDGETALVAALVDELARHELHPAQTRNLLRAAAMHRTLAGDPGACAAWAEVAAAARPGTGLRVESQRWLGRCERGTLPPPP